MSRVPNILVFDSGIGGISVYNEIQQRIPNANYFYLFDNQAFPYGDKSNAFLIKRVNKVIRAELALYPIDLVVIACNTASTICLPSLRQAFSIPIVGVVPAIKPATTITKNKCIGLLATKATIQRQYTQNLISEFAQGYHIELLGLSELALFAERKLEGIAVDMLKLKNLMQPWLQLTVPPDTIVLGCTHYPFIKDELATLFPSASFIDSGYAIASRVYHLLKDNFDLTKLNGNKGINKVNSTLFNPQVANVLKSIAKYNLVEYQHLNVDDV
ncbi:glutamate racemase [Frischella sp. Ac13]|uniref:Glutamate racemase n=1 Tax=Frischella japonica TaxID=2741544 RepID=A0ABR7QZT0_9GAMM|nr:glutamate racemase [Frischella japonica]MBC9131723.1 glutamate racemase [Frischella japonica]